MEGIGESRGDIFECGIERVRVVEGLGPRLRGDDENRVLNTIKVFGMLAIMVH